MYCFASNVYPREDAQYDRMKEFLKRTLKSLQDIDPDDVLRVERELFVSAVKHSCSKIRFYVKKVKGDISLVLEHLRPRNLEEGCRNSTS